MNKYWQYQYEGISGANNKCFESFLYLAITSHASNSKVETFADILNLLDELNFWYKELADLYLDENPNSSSNPKGLLGILFDNYKFLRGNSILCDVMDEREILSAEKLKAHIVKDTLKSYKTYETAAWYPDQEPSLWTIYGLEEPITIPDEEQDYVDNDKERNLVSSKLKILTLEECMDKKQIQTLHYENWKANLKNPERFIQTYKDFRKLFFLEGVNRNELEEIFIYFLDKKGKVKVSNVQNFATVYNTLKRIDKLQEVFTYEKKFK